MHTKSHLLLILSIFLFLCQSNAGQTATVVFISDTKVEIEIKDPIDGYPNSFYVTRKIKLEPNIPVSHEINVDDFAFLNIEPQQMYGRYSLLLLEGSHLTVNYLAGKTTLTGDNAAGIEYLYANYIKRGEGFYVNQLVPVMESKITDSIDFAGLDKEMEAWRKDLPYKKDLLHLLKEKNISNKAYDILSKTLEYFYLNVESDLYMFTMQGQMKGYVPPKEERFKLFERIENLCTDKRYLNEKAPKYLYSSNEYYNLKYRFLSEEKKDELNRQYDELVLGNFISWMLAPDYIQLPLFGDNTISQFQNGVGLLTSKEFVQWFQKKFPDKEHTKIISKLYTDQQEKLNRPNETQAIFLDNKAINSFQDLVQLKELKGKYLYIDLWASWCSPCLAQFKYGDQVHDLLHKYKDVSVVYISIDEDRNDKAWKKQIYFHHLNGFHIRTTETFSKYISSKLYDGKMISVPRYLLLDKNGDILEDNLPRPSELQKLEKALENFFKSNY